jgi:hypothetical protein
MRRPRCADDFATIRARMAELRRQREQLTRDENARSMTEPWSYHTRDGAVTAQRPGVPGRRVARRKHQFSQA